MRTRRGLALFPLVLSLSALAFYSRSEQTAHLHPANVPVNPLQHLSGDPVVTFPEAFGLQVAVFRTSGDEGMLGLFHALGQMGIPFFVTRDLDQALRHRLIILYPTIDARTFSPNDVERLKKHVSTGGSLISFNILTGALKPLFGYRDVAPSRHRRRVIFSATADPIELYLNRPEEREIQLGNPKYDEVFWTNGYTPDDSSQIMARFEDGTGAVLGKKTGAGTAYLFGLSLQDVILRNEVNRDYDAQRHYVNVFEPGSDVWSLLLRAWYESAQPDAVRLSAIPGGNSSLLLLSHDIDWENSFDPALDFAAMEERHHVKSTFFIQTKYVSDANSKAFFFGKNLEGLKKLRAMNFSIGSHSVIHSRGFNKFELGTGNETFASYQPQGTGFETAVGATVFGEIRVSKELLNGELPGQQTVFFRAGHLRVSPTMPEALQRCGYLFDSSFTAADVLTNLPYPLPLGLGFDEDSGILEFPLTFEDEESPRLDQRTGQTLEVVRANAENESISSILIHPNEARDKLIGEQNILEQLPSGVVATDMLSFARFWHARDRLKWTLVPGGTDLTARLKVTAEEAVEGLTFQFQHRIKKVDDNATLVLNHRQIVLRALKAGESVLVEIQYAE